MRTKRRYAQSKNNGQQLTNSKRLYTQKKSKTKSKPKRTRKHASRRTSSLASKPIIVFSSIMPPYTPEQYEHHKRATNVFNYKNLKQTKILSELPSLEEHSQIPSILPESIFRVFYFVHVPKTGGVALKLSLQKHALPHSSTHAPQNLLLMGQGQRTISKNTHTYVPSYTRFLSRGHLSARDVDPRIPTLCILREPFSRVRSAFRFLLEGGKHSEVWNFPEKQMMKLFQKHNITAISDIFERCDDNIREQILNHPHMRPQHTFVCNPDSSKVIIDHVFLLEHLRADEVASVLCIPTFKLVHNNQSHVPYTLTDKDKKYIQKYYHKDIEMYERYRKRINI